MIVLNDMKKLSAIDGPCLTIIQPIRDPYSQVTCADTRLVAAAQKADALLIENGYDAAARNRFLRPVFKIARNTRWAGRNGSVVILRAPGFTKTSFWPTILEGHVSLNDQFHVLPLLTELTASQSFWLLTLSIKAVRLYRGTPTDLTEVELPATLPHNLLDSEGFTAPDHDLAGQSTGRGQTGAVHFGTDSLHDKQMLHLRNFFKAVDRAILPRLQRSGDPLVLAAVPRELAIYREINSYKHLSPDAIHGSPEATNVHDLHAKALELVSANRMRFDGKVHTDIENAAGKGLLLTEAFAIREAARLGEIERLYIHNGLSAEEELINGAALDVMRNSGTVHFGDSPDGTAVAAILRYRVAMAPAQKPVMAA